MRQQEEEQQRRQDAVANNINIDNSEKSEPEIIFVNVWKNVDGKLKLAGQKPVTKGQIDKMQRKKDFSKLASQLQ